MTTPLIFPDIELWACAYLRTELAAFGYPGTYVSNRRGTQATAVWVRRDGGGALDQVREAPRLGVNCFAPSEQAVTDLARTVCALLIASPDGAPVVKATQITGPSPVADSGPRRFLSIELVVRGAELQPS
jgi:hypothetical protein